MEKLIAFASQDNVAKTTKAYELFCLGMELEEDEFLTKKGESRLDEIETNKAKTINHDDLWNKLKI